MELKGNCGDIEEEEEDCLETGKIVILETLQIVIRTSNPSWSSFPSPLLRHIFFYIAAMLQVQVATGVAMSVESEIGLSNTAIRTLQGSYPYRCGLCQYSYPYSYP